MQTVENETDLCLPVRFASFQTVWRTEANNRTDRSASTLVWDSFPGWKGAGRSKGFWQKNRSLNHGGWCVRLVKIE